jgi:hypothetical protein
MEAQKIQSMIENLKPGKCTSVREDKRFVEASPAAEGGYEVECGWTVPEAHDDDYMSFGGPSPFKGGRMAPWVGRRVVVPTTAEAAEIFVRWYATISQRKTVVEGNKIGSVSR